MMASHTEDTERRYGCRACQAHGRSPWPPPNPGRDRASDCSGQSWVLLYAASRGCPCCDYSNDKFHSERVPVPDALSSSRRSTSLLSCFGTVGCGSWARDAVMGSGVYAVVAVFSSAEKALPELLGFSATESADRHHWITLSQERGNFLFQMRYIIAPVEAIAISIPAA